MKGTAVLFHVSESNGIMHSLIVFLYTPLRFIPTLHFAASGFLNRVGQNEGIGHGVSVWVLTFIDTFLELLLNRRIEDWMCFIRNRGSRKRKGGKKASVVFVVSLFALSLLVLVHLTLKENSQTTYWILVWLWIPKAASQIASGCVNKHVTTRLIVWLHLFRLPACLNLLLYPTCLCSAVKDIQRWQIKKMIIRADWLIEIQK